MIAGTESDYDRFLYLERKDISNNIRAAEVRFEYAKSRAAEVGVLPKDQTSGFGHYPEDREPGTESEVRRKLSAFNEKPVEDWRENVNARGQGGLRDPERPRGVSEEPEIDAFSVPSLEVGDSLFRFAAGKTRGKIDRYGVRGRRNGSGDREDALRSPGRGFCNSGGLWE